MPRPPQSALDALYRQLQDEPSHGPGTFVYPRPRARKLAGIAAADLADGVLNGAGPAGAEGVRTKLWSYFCDPSAANTRTTVVSPPFVGPLLIHEMVMRYGGAVGAAGGMSLWYSTEGGGGATNVAPTVLPTGTKLFETASARSGGTVDGEEVPEHIVYVAPSDAALTLHAKPRLLIPVFDRVFLKISMRSSGTGGNHTRGWLGIYEGTSLAQLLMLPS